MTTRNSTAKDNTHAAKAGLIFGPPPASGFRGSFIARSNHPVPSTRVRGTPISGTRRFGTLEWVGLPIAAVLLVLAVKALSAPF